jgi:hypothetical protein
VRLQPRPRCAAAGVLTATRRSAFLRDAIDDDLLSADTGGWLRLHLRAHASLSDVLLPIGVLLFINLSASLLPWWTTVALLPGVMIACGALQYMSGLVAGGHVTRPRMSVVMVAGLLVAGVLVFATKLVPALRDEHPKMVAFEAIMFASNAVVFWRTVFNDPGFVAQGGAASVPELTPARLCATCNAFRPLRSKHDPFTGRCVRCVRAVPLCSAASAHAAARRRFDHYCPLVFNAVGEDNQADFVLFCFTMYGGQLAFLRLCSTYLSQEGEGIFDTLLHHTARGWVAHPVVMINFCFQLAATMFNTLLCVRAVYAVFAELTSNEIANLHRYTYLYNPDTGEYDNPFDSGILRNTGRYFAGLRGVPPPDWDAMHDAARAGKLPRPPLLSMAVLFRYWERVRASCGWVPRERSAGGPAHGHSHGGRECGHDHGSHSQAPAHGHSHGGRECSHDHGAAAHGHGQQGQVKLSQLPPALQQQVLAELASRGLTPEAVGLV